MATQRQRLRTKTGCLICKLNARQQPYSSTRRLAATGRKRRKKCDEQSPICGRCALSGRQCQWPTSEELLDRRYASHQRSRHSTVPITSQLTSVNVTDLDGSAICLTSEAVAHRVIAGDLELVISRHFIDQYYGLLLLPNCHPEFYHGWINEIQVLMVKHSSLHYSLLANAASHLHFIEGSSQMQELALNYYSKALRGLSNLLAKPGQLENNNGILMSVMLLYLHGCMGRGTYFDIPRHLNAAARMLTIRLFGSPVIISSPFDRLAVESVLYQIFLVITGLWSDEIPLDYKFDTNFWRRAEKLMDDAIMFPDQPNSVNSPVLGVPVPLFRLAITLKQIYQGSLILDQPALEKVRGEVEVWEGIALSDEEFDASPTAEEKSHKHGYYKDASYLFVLIVSLLLEQSATSASHEAGINHGSTSMESSGKGGPPRMASSESWQVKKAIHIFTKYRNDDEWASCFIGNWPVYTIGFFMSTSDDVALTRRELERRWQSTKFNQVARFWNDLESTWVRRGFEPLTKAQTMSLEGLMEALPQARRIADTSSTEHHSERSLLTSISHTTSTSSASS